jgi:hypothetical protein
MSKDAQIHCENILRSGFIFKRGSGNGFFRTCHLKPRYCALAYHKLFYFKYRGGTLKGVVNIAGCTKDDILVMPQECNHNRKSCLILWPFAIQAPERRFVFCACSAHDMNIWVQAILAILEPNYADTLVLNVINMHSFETGWNESQCLAKRRSNQL